jgi:hypothetical protein
LVGNERWKTGTMRCRLVVQHRELDGDRPDPCDDARRAARADVGQWAARTLEEESGRRQSGAAALNVWEAGQSASWMTTLRTLTCP